MDFEGALVRALGERGAEILLAAVDENVAFVGGWVRDTLIGRESGDVDLSTSDPEGLLERLVAAGSKKPICLDAERGTWRVVLARGRFVDVCALKGETLLDDLRARDLTINAIAWVPGRGLVDPLGGAEDLRLRRLRLAHEGAIEEDPLRALRVVRFGVRLGVQPRAPVVRAMEAAQIERVADERIRAELAAILVEDLAVRGVDLMRRTGLLRVLPPADVEFFREAMERDWSTPALRRIRAQVATEADGEVALRLGWLLPGVTAEELTERRWPRRVARRAAEVGDAGVVDGSRAAELVRWKSSAAFVLAGRAVRGGEEAVAPYLAMLDEAAGGQNPKALPVPPLPKPLIPAQRIQSRVGTGPQISAAIDALLTEQLEGRVPDLAAAEQWFSALGDA